MTVQSTIIGTGAVASGLGPVVSDPSSAAAGIVAAAQPLSGLAFTGAGAIELAVGLGLIFLAAGSLLVGLARRHRPRSPASPTVT